MKLSKFAQNMLATTYIHNGETIDERFDTISYLYAANKSHQERMLQYMTNSWVIPSSPILFNSTKELKDKMIVDGEFKFREYELLGIVRNLPISCFGQYIPDTLKGIIDTA